MTKPYAAPILALTLLSLSILGCQAVIYEKGTILDPEAVSQIRIGETTRPQVKRLLGFPTFVNTFRNERWLYIQDRHFKNFQRTFSRTANRVEVTFDKQGRVSALRRNFGDQLLNPETLPEAQDQQSWLTWLWNGEYDKPTTETHHTPSSGLPPEKALASAKRPSPSGKSHSWDPWWRFWPREESTQKE